uniref:Serine/threonine-protein kinase n=1 Tax=Anisakis simplex TaxID=6269 RepID=A0A0M3JBI7_ANISI
LKRNAHEHRLHERDLLHRSDDNLHASTREMLCDDNTLSSIQRLFAYTQTASSSATASDLFTDINVIQPPVRSVFDVTLTNSEQNDSKNLSLSLNLSKSAADIAEPSCSSSTHLGQRQDDMNLNLIGESSSSPSMDQSNNNRSDGDDRNLTGRSSESNATETSANDEHSGSKASTDIHSVSSTLYTAEENQAELLNDNRSDIDIELKERLESEF